jgi:hypothetical protein
MASFVIDFAAMDVPAVAPPRKDIRRKRLFIIAAGLAVTLAIIYIAAVEYLSSPTPWNKKAITAQYSGLTIQKFGPASDTRIDVIYQYRIHNSGKHDYTLSQPPIGQLMTNPNDGKDRSVLKDATWPPGITVPANQTINIAFTVSYQLANFNAIAADLEDEKKLAEFVDSRLNASSLVFIDYGARYEIALPLLLASGSGKN